VFSLGRSRPGPRLRTLTYVATQPQSAVIKGLHLRDPCKHMDYYSFTYPKGWKAELAWLVDP